MKREIHLIIIFSFCFANFSLAQQLSPRTANYQIDVVLDVPNKMLYGTSIITWTNPSEKPIADLQFHLYYNAFKNSESTFMKSGSQFGFLGKSLEEECGWSYSEIISLHDRGKNELAKNSTYIAPDDGNDADQTVLLVPLVEAVGPGESAVFEMKWKAKIPKSMVRTGYNQEYYFFAQWFPKLGVYEPAGMRYEQEGAWNCHQYHASGEYYGEFGNYDVTMHVPLDFKVASSGSLIEEVAGPEEKTYRFAVDDVIDFTWSCSPRFIQISKPWQDVDLHLYTYPGHEIFADRYFTSAIQSLDYLDRYVGKYPYKTLTIVDPPIHGLFTGGMEYPTLITSLSSRFFPAGVKAPETLVVHEFIHQYFMQMLASHEQEEPWMDEGLTTYYESRILDHYYGEKTSLLDTRGVQLGNGEYNRYQFWSSANPKIADNSYKARDFAHGGYSEVAYNKTAMMLKTLEGILGRDTFDRIMKNYFEQWKFKHPCGLDFVQVFKDNLSEEVLKEVKLDLDLFFEQALYGSVECDYSVAPISNSFGGAPSGFITSIDSCVLGGDTALEPIRNRVIIHRLGEMILPVDVRVNFSDGTQHLWVWDGVERSTEFMQWSDTEVVCVQLDPQRKLNLEKNFINNTYMLRKSNRYRKYTSKFKVGMQHLLDFLNFLS